MPDIFTPNSALVYPTVADRTWNTRLEADLRQLDSTPAIGSLCVTTFEQPVSTSLLVNVSAGSMISSGGHYVSYPGVLGLAMTASVTSLVWLTDAGALATGLAWPGAAHVRLASVTAGTSTITSIVDMRTPWRAALT